MKNATPCAKKLKSLLNRLGKEEAPEAEPVMDPVLRLVHAFLLWNATGKQAEKAFERLVGGIVDANDLRVHTQDEIVETLGARYPIGVERAARMLDVLQEIYDRERDTTLERLHGLGKKEIREYLKTLPGMVPYAEACVSLLSFDAHAVPVDEKLMEMLVAEGVIDPGADLAETIGFLERTIRAEEAAGAHRLLQRWADAKAGRLTDKQAVKFRQAADAKRKGEPLESKQVIIRKTTKATKQRSEAAKEQEEAAKTEAPAAAKKKAPTVKNPRGPSASKSS